MKKSVPNEVVAPLSLERSPFFKLLQLVNLTARPFDRLYRREHRLSLAEWRVMLTLASSPGLSAAEIADTLGLDKMTISRAVRGLEKSKRVARAPDPEDGRRTHLALTLAGWKIYRLIAPSARAREDALFSGLDNNERRLLDRALDRLLVRARGLPDA
jgi:DNA-binding MarR family transcriptional regulator